MIAVVGVSSLAFMALAFTLFYAYGRWHAGKNPIRVSGVLLVVDKGRGFVAEKILLSCLIGVESMDDWQAGMKTYTFRTSTFMNTPTLRPEWINDGDRLIALLHELARVNRDIDSADQTG